MTHRRDNIVFDQVFEVLIEKVLDGMAVALEVIFNEAMKFEIESFLGAESLEKTKDHRGYGNRFKDKTASSMISALQTQPFPMLETRYTRCPPDTACTHNATSLPYFSFTVHRQISDQPNPTGVPPALDRVGSRRLGDQRLSYLPAGDD